MRNKPGLAWEFITKNKLSVCVTYLGAGCRAPKKPKEQTTTQQTQGPSCSSDPPTCEFSFSPKNWEGFVVVVLFCFDCLDPSLSLFL